MTCSVHWGKGSKPVHWSGLDLLNRSKKLDKHIEYLAIKDDDKRNFAIHTGVAGILNLSPTNFEAMCAFALNVIGDCLLAELHILGDELKLADAIPNYTAILEELDKVQVYAFADKTLQAIGEPTKYHVHAGEPSASVKVSGSVERLF